MATVASPAATSAIFCDDLTVSTPWGAMFNGLGSERSPGVRLLLLSEITLAGSVSLKARWWRFAVSGVDLPPSDEEAKAYSATSSG